MTLTQEIKKFADELALLIQDTILQMGHVETGAMLKSMKVKVTAQNEVQIDGISYFKYVDDRYKIIATAKRTGEYKLIMQQFKKLIAKKYKEELKRR